MTKEQVQKRLQEEYLKAMKEGKDDIASLNINDWIEENNIEIVKEDDKRLTKKNSNKSNKKV